MDPLRILFATSELAPFAKTGGLADVSAALPRHLHALGHDVRLVLPLYRRVREHGAELRPVEGLQRFPVQIGTWTFVISVHAATLPGTTLDVWLIDCPALYDRPGIYTQDTDEHLRFLLLTRAALETCQRTQWSPDIVHANDWQTALAPLFLKSLYRWDRLFEHTKSVLTIHNLGYQGVFGSNVQGDLALGDAAHLLHQEDLREGRINFLKTGLIYADLLTTVSPTYAREIQTETRGFGLDAILRQRANALVGILNGVDDEEWNPRTDKLIPSRYSVKSLWRKEKNKEHLLTSLGLAYTKGVPVIGIVSRLSGQKGIELLDPVMFELLRERDIRFVALGSGETQYETLLQRLQAQFPGKAVFWRGYSNENAHLIEAGADIFIMPSLYEPCGLNQMYSLKYGTIPVVRNTGGLADTVTMWNPKTGEGNGFLFDHYTTDGLRWGLRVALDAYADREAWTTLQKNGMAQDFGWTRQAQAYVDAYRRVAAKAEARTS